MASSKAVPKTGRSSKKKAPDQAEISRATWAGVALVIAALVAVITLAVVSPSDPGSGTEQTGLVGRPSPNPSAGTVDDRLPTERPAITSPADGFVTGEREFEVTVSVARDPLPARLLTLEILRGGVVVGSKKPKQATDITVAGVRLVEGPNELTAALRGPGGRGPMSEPITILVDRDGPSLTLTSPQDNEKTIEGTVLVAGTTEPGVSVKVLNQSKKWEDVTTVGNSGTFEQVVPLVEGKNRIIVVATDEVGNVDRVRRVVMKQNGRPFVELSAPKKVALKDLPTEIRLRVDVTDDNKKPIEGAAVTFTLIEPLQGAETFETETNASGRATWRAPISRRGSRQDVIRAAVKVTAPNGKQRTEAVDIEYS